MPSPFEALEIFYEFFVVVKIVSITMDSEFFQNVFLKDVRFPLMFQKQIYLNPFRQRCNIRWNNYKDNDWKAQWVKSTCKQYYLSIFIQRNIMGFYKIAV